MTTLTAPIESDRKPTVILSWLVWGSGLCLVGLIIALRLSFLWLNVPLAEMVILDICRLNNLLETRPKKLFNYTSRFIVVIMVAEVIRTVLLLPKLT